MKKVYNLLVLITCYITMHGSNNVKLDSICQQTGNVRVM